MIKPRRLRNPDRRLDKTFVVSRETITDRRRYSCASCWLLIWFSFWLLPSCLTSVPCGRPAVEWFLVNEHRICKCIYRFSDGALRRTGAWARRRSLSPGAPRVKAFLIYQHYVSVMLSLCRRWLFNFSRWLNNRVHFHSFEVWTRVHYLSQFVDNKSSQTRVTNCIGSHLGSWRGFICCGVSAHQLWLCTSSWRRRARLTSWCTTSRV